MANIPSMATGALSSDSVSAVVYDGKGSHEVPFVVEFQKDDPINPMNWSSKRKWLITAIATLSVFAVTFASSAYSSSANEVMSDFSIGTELFIVGVSLFVLGFAIGPAVWGPLVSFIMALGKIVSDKFITTV